MSTFIHREIAKTTVNGEEFYVCMYVHDEVLVNLTFYKKTEAGFEEMLRHHVSADVGKELVQKVRLNEVEKVTPSEAKLFNQSLDKHSFFVAREIKETINKTVKDMKVDYVGEVAGIQYLSSESKQTKMKQLFLLQKSAVAEEFEIGKIPAPFVEMVILDYVHHVKVGTTTLYIMLDEMTFMALKRDVKNPSMIYVVNIHLYPDSVSASKAYVISKKNQYEYTLLPIQKSSPQLMERLKEEGKGMINQFIKQMNITTK